jgi:hypothetical protein
MGCDAPANIWVLRSCGTSVHRLVWSFTNTCSLYRISASVVNRLGKLKYIFCCCATRSFIIYYQIFATSCSSIWISVNISEPAAQISHTHRRSRGTFKHIFYNSLITLLVQNAEWYELYQNIQREKLSVSYEFGALKIPLTVWIQAWKIPQTKVRIDVQLRQTCLLKAVDPALVCYVG